MPFRRTVVVIVAIVLIVSVNPPSFSEGWSGNAAAVASLADLATEVLTGADENTLSPAERRDLMAALYGLAGADPVLHTPETNAALGRALLRSASEARRGDKDFLTAMMMMPVSPYGGTAEGAEWINELLWEILGAQPQASIDTLAALSPDIRDRVVAGVYTAPIHDGFDFAAMLTAQERVEVPANFAAGHDRIVRTLRESAR